jgi:amino acid adenylation domain-containing protein
LDPNYPAERLEYMVQDAAPRIIIAHSSTRPLLSHHATTGVAIDDPESLRVVTSRSNPDAVEVVGQNTVYVIYTSGSTGRPKGTAMCHRAMANLIAWHRRSLPLRVGERVLQFAALSFDVAFQETFSTLCGGGTLLLVGEWIRRDAPALLRFISANRIERLFLPPLVLQGLSESASETDRLDLATRDFIVAGEQLQVTPEISRFLQQIPGCRLHNHYGPTETHVVTTLTLEGDPAAWPSAPAIGRPISNSQVYVLNSRYSVAPIGVVGEIYLAGSCLARGYLRRPELTAARFVASPFARDHSARMYKTGDLGRWREDGTLEYLGRNDHQIKIRGFRIEPGEIESALLGHPGVRDVKVLAWVNAQRDKRLVAYMVAENGASLSAETLRASLKNKLPEYMIPTAFIVLSRFELTPNGKLDTRALPSPEAALSDSECYESPQGALEESIASIWSELLHVRKVGRNDDFFQLGGHSLLATQVMSRIAQRHSINVPLRTLFERPVLRDLAELIDSEYQMREEQEVQHVANLADQLQGEIDSMSDEDILARIAELESQFSGGDAAAL